MRGRAECGWFCWPGPLEEHGVRGRAECGWFCWPGPLEEHGVREGVAHVSGGSCWLSPSVSLMLTLPFAVYVRRMLAGNSTFLSTHCSHLDNKCKSTSAMDTDLKC